MAKQLHVRLHVQPFYPEKQPGQKGLGRRSWRVGLEKKSVEALEAACGEELYGDYEVYGKGTVELERVNTQAQAIKVGTWWQRAMWEERQASSSLYVHDRKNVILKGNAGEQTYPRSADPNPPAGVKRHL